MSKKEAEKRKQPEFLFVFNREASPESSGPASETEHCGSSSLNEDVAKVHRDKLLAELREFGC